MFTRRTFGKLIAGLAVASPAMVRALPMRRVIVVGAGAAGLKAAYHLKKQGVDVRVLEASHRWGGRVKRLSGFSNVPLDLGAEWIHDDPTILGQILSMGDNDLGVETIPYDPQTFRFWHDGALNKADMLRHAYEELKFRDTTWFGFFERFVFPDILGDIQLGAEVAASGRASDGVSVRTREGSVLEADRVLITVPISMLRNAAIAFQDGLDASRLNDLADNDFGLIRVLFEPLAQLFANQVNHGRPHLGRNRSQERRVRK